MSGALRRLGLAAALALLAACGHRGSPTPPQPHLPRTPEPVHWRLRGDQLEIAARIAAVTLDGRPLRGAPRVELLVLPAPAPERAAGWDVPARAREFLREARAVALEQLEPDAREPSWRRYRVPLGALGEAPAYVVALALADGGSRSAPSPRRLLQPAEPPPAPPGSCQLEPREEGIRASWPAEGLGEKLSVRLYRSSGEGGFGAPVAEALAPAGEALDRAVRFGEEAAYELVSATTSGEIAVESAPVPCGRLRYEDRFPPAPPRDLDAVAQSGRIRVFWRSGGSDDEAVVVVERQEREGAPFLERARVAAPDFFFEDRDVRPGRRYRYRVAAVDRAGNRSEFAGPTDWLSPRPPEGTDR